jgi:hypothetical protein
MTEKEKIQWDKDERERASGSILMVFALASFSVFMSILLFCVFSFLF